MNQVLVCRYKLQLFWSISILTQHKNWSFSLRISSVNVTKSTVCCGFGRIYWRNLWWKTSYFAQCETREILYTTIGGQCFYFVVYMSFVNCFFLFIFVLFFFHVPIVNMSCKRNHGLCQKKFCILTSPVYVQVLYSLWFGARLRAVETSLSII